MFTAILTHTLLITSWKDIAEIMFFTLIIYGISAWLTTNNNKTIVVSFYLYCLCATGATLLHFNTVSCFLIAYGPVFLLLLCIVHQETLHRNIIGLSKNVPFAIATSEQLIKVIMQTLLHNQKNMKPTHFIIERTHHLNNSLCSQYPLNAPITINTLLLLLDSSRYEPSNMIWLTSEGTIRAINCSWQFTSNTGNDTSLSQQLWYQEAQRVTHATDAIVVACTQTDKDFLMIAHGMICENLSAHRVATLLRYYCSQKSETKKESINHDQYPQKNFSNQSSA